MWSRDSDNHDYLWWRMGYNQKVLIRCCSRHYYMVKISSYGHRFWAASTDFGKESIGNSSSGAKFHFCINGWTIVIKSEQQIHVFGRDPYSCLPQVLVKISKNNFDKFLFHQLRIDCVYQNWIAVITFGEETYPLHPNKNTIKIIPWNIH